MNDINPLGPVEHTGRGFEIVKFTDRSGVPCSLQQSSLADFEKPGTSAIWLGPSEADPRVMASDAAALGVATSQTTGWVPYPIPEQVLLSTRMHLDRDQVKSLIAHLQMWLDADTFGEPHQN